MDAVVWEKGHYCTVHLVSFLLQFVFIYLFWELAVLSLRSWWYQPGPWPNVFLQVRLHSAAFSPFICQAVPHPLPHVPLFWRGPAVCPAIGHGVRGRRSTKTSADRGGGGFGAHTRRKGLTFRGKLSRFVYRAMCLLHLMKGRWAKGKKNVDSEQWKGRAGVVVPSVCWCVCEGL